MGWRRSSSRWTVRWSSCVSCACARIQPIVAEFDEKLDQSWIYHDNALEGVVLSYHELKAAIDKKIISDVTLIPMYEEIKNHKAAIETGAPDGARPGPRSAHDEEAASEEEPDHARHAQALALAC